MVQLIVEPAHIVCRLSLFLPFLEGLHYSLMLWKFGATRAGPSTCKATTLLTSRSATLPSDTIMLFEWVLAQAFEVISSMWGNIVKGLALALGGSTRRFLAIWREIVMVFELVVAEAFGLRADHLAVLTLLVTPRQVQPVFGFFWNGKADWLSDVQIIKFFLCCIHCTLNKMIVIKQNYSA